jgi:tetratricopeptide (TPR) repeat protein
MFPGMSARYYNERGQVFLNQKRDFARAERAFLKAAAASPRWDAPWYNLGLAAKWQHHWQKSLEWNLKAVERDPSNQAAWWNMGIAATALGDWAQARRAWTGFGLKLPPGEGEIVMDLGPTPIRLDPEHNAEVVWCQRIDPARAVIRNVPLPDSGNRYGDRLLHDGAPSGERRLHGQVVPVFDVIEVLEQSTYSNFEVELRGTDAQSLDALFKLAADENIGLEDWGTIRCLCSACSRGKAPAAQEEDDRFAAPREPTGAVRLMAAALDIDSLTAILDRWKQAEPGGSILRVEQVDYSSSV